MVQNPGVSLAEAEEAAKQFVDRKRLSRMKKAIVGDGYLELVKLKNKLGMLLISFSKHNVLIYISIG